MQLYEAQAYFRNIQQKYCNVTQLFSNNAFSKNNY